MATQRQLENIDFSMSTFGALVPVAYQIVEELELGSNHVHLLISTEEYGMLEVCSVDGQWNVQPAQDPPGFIA